MHILILSQWFYPEPGPRVHELACGLKEKGHKVSVITGFPTVPYNHFYSGYDPSFYKRENYNGVEVLRLPHFPHGQKSALKRMLHYSSFMLSSIFIGSALIEKADCMYVFFPPPIMGITAWFYKLLKKIPFMFDIQDIWPEGIIASGLTNKKWVIEGLKTLEKIVYPLSGAISVPSEGFKENLIKKGVSSDKIEVIPNWADEEIYKPMPYSEEIAIKYKMKGKFNITFAGNMGLAQDINTIIESAVILKENPKIQFVFVGDGLVLNEIKEKCKNQNINNVIFLGRLPQSEMAQLFAVSEVLLVHLKKDPAFEITIPSKTQAYLACSKPILMAVEGDASRLIESTNSGISCMQGNPQELAGKALLFFNMPKEDYNKIAGNAFETYKNYFTKKVVFDKFEKLLLKIAQNGKEK